MDTAHVKKKRYDMKIYPKKHECKEKTLNITFEREITRSTNNNLLPRYLVYVYINFSRKSECKRKPTRNKKKMSQDKDEHIADLQQY